MATTQIDAAEINAVRLVKQASTPATPAASSGLLFLDTSNTLKIVLDNGSVFAVDSGGGGGTPVHCDIISESAQSATAFVWTKLLFETEVTDTGQFDLANNRFLCDADGLYIVHIYGHVSGGANKFGAQIRIDGGVVFEAEATNGNGNAHDINHVFLCPMESGDDVQFYGYQTTDTVLEGSAAYPQRLQIWKL